MNITEFANNVTSWSDPIDPFLFMNQITGDYLFWSAVYISFAFIILIALLRRNYDYRTVFIASMFPTAIIGILFVVIGLINIEIVTITIVLLSFAGILFNKTD